MESYAGSIKQRQVYAVAELLVIFNFLIYFWGEFKIKGIISMDYNKWTVLANDLLPSISLMQDIFQNVCIACLEGHVWNFLERHKNYLIEIFMYFKAE